MEKNISIHPKCEALFNEAVSYTRECLDEDCCFMDLAAGLSSIYDQIFGPFLHNSFKKESIRVSVENFFRNEYDCGYKVEINYRKFYVYFNTLNHNMIIILHGICMMKCPLSEQQAKRLNYLIDEAEAHFDSMNV